MVGLLRDGRYILTSLTIHLIIFLLISILYIRHEVTTAKPLFASVSVRLVDISAESCPIVRKKQTDSVAVKNENLQNRVERTEQNRFSTVEEIQSSFSKSTVKLAESTVLAVSQNQAHPVPVIPSESENLIPSQSHTDLIPAENIIQDMYKTHANETQATAPIYDAAYLNNPRPHYPKVSKRLGEEGIVLLKVRVLADGSAESVSILKSSTFERLDACALEAVKRWRFVAAKQGDKSVESWVSVPVVFKLNS